MYRPVTSRPFFMVMYTLAYFDQFHFRVARGRLAPKNHLWQKGTVLKRFEIAFECFMIYSTNYLIWLKIPPFRIASITNCKESRKSLTEQSHWIFTLVFESALPLDPILNLSVSLSPSSWVRSELVRSQLAIFVNICHFWIQSHLPRELKSWIKATLRIWANSKAPWRDKYSCQRRGGLQESWWDDQE